MLLLSYLPWCNAAALQHPASHRAHTDSLTALDVHPGGVQLHLRADLPDHHQQVEPAAAERARGPQPLLGTRRTLVLFQHGEHLHGNSPRSRRRDRLHRHDNCPSARAERERRAEWKRVHVWGGAFNSSGHAAA